MFERPVASPRTRTLPARSFTIDTPYNYFEPSEPSLKEDEPPAASPATGRAASPPASRRVDVVNRPAGRDTTTTITPDLPPSSRSSLHNSAAGAPLQRSAVSERSRTTETEEKPTTAVSSSSALQKVAEPRRPFLRAQTEVEAPSPGFLYKQQPQPSSMEPKPPGVSHVSASLPRSYQKSDSARLSAVVTARPFGTQASRITSLPRVFAVSTRWFHNQTQTTSVAQTKGISRLFSVGASVIRWRFMCLECFGVTHQYDLITVWIMDEVSVFVMLTTRAAIFSLLTFITVTANAIESFSHTFKELIR